MITIDDHLIRRFPLVPRPRPDCPTLDQRIANLQELVRSAGRLTGPERLAKAAAAHNQAALVASDCGLHDLARALCLRQFRLYYDARPLDASATRHALEPLVNLARLLIRAGEPVAAFELLEGLYTAESQRSTLAVDGQYLSFDDLSYADDGTVHQWLWSVRLAEGTRALVSAGRWEQALHHAQRHGGIGDRLLDGRQVAILAHLLTGDAHRAAAILDETTTSEPWELAVAACLDTLCTMARGAPADSAVATMIDRYLALDTGPELLVFTTRLGLSVVDLADGTDDARRTSAIIRLTRDVIGARNGYAARDMLTHDASRRHLEPRQYRALAAIVRTTGVSHDRLPDTLTTDLLSIADASETITSHHLTNPSIAAESHTPPTPASQL